MVVRMPEARVEARVSPRCQPFNAGAVSFVCGFPGQEVRNQDLPECKNVTGAAEEPAKRQVGRCGLLIRR